MVSNSPDSVISHHITEHFSVKGSRLTEIAVGMVWFMSGNQTSDFVGFIAGLTVEGECVCSLVETVGLVVGGSS